MLESTDDLLGSCRSSAPRRATRTRPVGRRSRRSAGTACAITASVLGVPSEAQRNADLAGCSPGASRSTTPHGASTAGASTGSPRRATGARRSSSSRAKRRPARSASARPLVERVVVSTSLAASRGPWPARRRGAGLRGGRLIARGRSSPRRRFPPSDAAGKVALVRPPHGPPSRRARLVAHVVGRGHSRDRHRHTQRRARPLAHRPDLQARAPPPGEQRARARRRQGDQRRPRAEAARRPRRRDRSRGRPHGNADRRGADRGGDPQRLRPDPRRVAHVDRRRRPDLGDLHRDQRVGPEGVGRRARDPARQAPLPLPRRVGGRLRRLAAARRRRGRSTRTRCAR